MEGLHEERILKAMENDPLSPKCKHGISAYLNCSDCDPDRFPKKTSLDRPPIMESVLQSMKECWSQLMTATAVGHDSCHFTMTYSQNRMHDFKCKFCKAKFNLGESIISLEKALEDAG